MSPLYLRPDGTLVVRLANGLPYHVLPNDPLWPAAEELDWSLAVPEPPPPPPQPPIIQPPAIVTEAQFRAVLIALGYSANTVETAIEAAR